MRNSVMRGMVILPLLLFTFSCSKIDWDDVWGHHGPLPKCDLAAYRLTSMYPDITFPFLFEKTYNPGGRQVRTIDASFFNEIADLIHFRLRIENKGRNIYLVNMDAPYDTSMTIRLNKYGKPESATGVEVLGSYEFYYTNNRLTSYLWTGFGLWHCQYDDQGNIISTSYPGGDGYLYDYDYSKKATQQFYMDELRFIDDGMTLMQYLGLFPELTPVNLRTRVRIGSTRFGYFYDRYLVNHQLDNSGRLVQYNSVSCNHGYCEPEGVTARLEWNCR